MKTYNKVDIQGFLGQDPELRTYGEGKEFVTFTLATHEKFKNKDGQDTEKTEWHNVTVFKPWLVEALKSVKKGYGVKVEGKNRTTVIDSEAEKKYFFSVQADDITVIQTKSLNSTPPIGAMPEEIAKKAAEEAAIAFKREERQAKLN